jgi:glycosyltransferase involved in cell wall biosynthesis
MAMGIPTVTTPICARSLAHGHEQTLFVRDQPSEIASALLELLSNPHQLSQIGPDSRSYILRNYDLNSLSGKIESLFQDAVEHFGKRKP